MKHKLLVTGKEINETVLSVEQSETQEGIQFGYWLTEKENKQWNNDTIICKWYIKQLKTK